MVRDGPRLGRPAADLHGGEPLLVDEPLEILDIFASDNRVGAFGTFTYTSTVLGQEVTSPFAVLAKVDNRKVVYTQFMEDSFATARSFRPGGTWTIQSNPDGSVIEV